MRNYAIILLLPFLFIFINGFSQEDKTTEKLAVQFYQNGEYEKALPLFEELFNKDEESDYIYEYYFNTLVKLEDYRTAEKVVKKRIRKKDVDYRFLIDLGYVYDLQGESKKEAETYDEIIRNLAPNPSIIQVVANSFDRRGKVEFAVKTYLRGRELLKNENFFNLQLARLYMQEGQHEKMLEEYITLTNISPGSTESVQDELQELVMEEAVYEIMKNMLLQRIQEEPANAHYVDLLSWLFIQQKDFFSAYIQLKALDKRASQGEPRLFHLAEVAIDNGEYKVAADIYRYIVEKGSSNPWYFRAQQGLLDVRYERITRLREYDREDLEKLEKDYEAFIKENLFRLDISGEATLRLAEIKASFLGKTDEAILLLEDFLQRLSTRGNVNFIARAKIDLGDFYLLKNDVWEATLFYAQVEKMFRDHPLGHEAKYRNARLSFYRGDFDWALAQLKVLKGSTSELIANDALNLSILIQDNRGLDTSDVPTHMFARADFLIFKNNFEEADKTMDSILVKFPGHTLTDEIWFAKGKMMYKKRDFQSAVELYARVYTDFAKDILADDALFKAAEIYEMQLGQPDKARDLYEKLILEHQGSVFNVEARKRFRRLRGDTL